MHRLGTGLLAGGDDLVGDQVGLLRCGGPMQTDSSASSTCIASLSASEYTATVLMPILRAVLMTRQAISPRLAIRIFLNIAILRIESRVEGRELIYGAPQAREFLLSTLCSPLSTYKGMLPCLRHGFSSFLFFSIASERQMRLRVSCGMITSSMKPRAPAMKGLANFSLYSASRAPVWPGRFFLRGR
jgi:hypothetical protein